ncbi:MAG: hypothetical protein U1F57_10220 [bacterium]
MGVRGKETPFFESEIPAPPAGREDSGESEGLDEDSPTGKEEAPDAAVFVGEELEVSEGTLVLGAAASPESESDRATEEGGEESEEREMAPWLLLVGSFAGESSEADERDFSEKVAPVVNHACLPTERQKGGRRGFSSGAPDFQGGARERWLARPRSGPSARGG